jgi:hypothetical protein
VETGLEAAAKSKGRSLSAEGAARLAQSLSWDREIFFEEPRQLVARKLLGHYTIGGVGVVVRLLLSLEDPHSSLEPGEAERAHRRQAMVEMLLAYVDTDAERQAAFFFVAGGKRSGGSGAAGKDRPEARARKGVRRHGLAPHQGPSGRGRLSEARRRRAAGARRR